MASLRVVIADDSLLLREGLARLLKESDFDVVAQAADAEDLIRKVGAHHPDVAIVDVRMPPDFSDEGLRAAREIRERWPEPASWSSPSTSSRHSRWNCSPTAPTGSAICSSSASTTSTDSPAAIRRVAAGGSALDPTVVSQLLGRASSDGPLERLTGREREVLTLLAEGRSNQGMADTLFLTERGVEKHITNIYSKLEIPSASSGHRRVLAVLTYLTSSGSLR